MTLQKTAHSLLVSTGAVFLLLCPLTVVHAEDAAPPPSSAQLGLTAAADAATLKYDNLSTYIGIILKGLFGVLGIIFLGLMLYGGIQWMLAQGEPKEVEKARSTLINATIGLVVVAGSYAATNFVIEKIISQAVLSK